MTVPPPVSRDRMSGRYFDACDSCRVDRGPGIDCSAGPVPPRTTRKREKAGLRRYVGDLLATGPYDPLVDPSDCRHGCNGACAPEAVGS